VIDIVWQNNALFSWFQGISRKSGKGIENQTGKKSR
jgi:hypothetical protein